MVSSWQSSCSPALVVSHGGCVSSAQHGVYALFDVVVAVPCRLDTSPPPTYVSLSSLEVLPYIQRGWRGRGRTQSERWLCDVWVEISHVLSSLSDLFHPFHHLVAHEEILHRLLRSNVCSSSPCEASRKAFHCEQMQQVLLHPAAAWEL